MAGFGIQLLFGDYGFLKAQLDLAVLGNIPVLPTDPTGIRDLRGVANNVLNPTWGTADTLFKRFSFNSFTAGLRGNGGTYTGSLSTTTFSWRPSALGLSYMGFTTQGTANALGVAFNNDLNYAKHYGGLVANALQPSGWAYSPTAVVDYSVRGTTITDARPRLISNLISNQADQTLLAVQDDPLTTPGGRVNPLTGVDNPLPYSMYLASWGQYLDHGLDLVLKGRDGRIQVPILPGDEMYTGPGRFLTVSRTNTTNVSIQAGSTDLLITAWGLAQTGVASFTPVTSANVIPAAANTGTLMLNGRLINFANATAAGVVTTINAETAWTGVTASLDATNRLVLTPARAESFNTISPHLDLSQEYGSDASQRIYLLEYTSIGGVPTPTGNLLNESVGGVVNLGASGFGSSPRWSDIKANAAKLGLTLRDYNVGDTPQIKTNADGTVWLDPVTRTARFLAVNNTTGAVVEIRDTALDQLATAGLTLLTVGHAFLNDRGPFSLASDGTGVPGFPFALTPQGDNPVGYDAGMVTFFTTNGFGTFQPLDRHVIAGDGRTNENIGLTAIQELWHNEHNRNVENIKTTFGLTQNLVGGVWDGTYRAFATPASAVSFPGAPVGDIWTGEMLFQAAKLLTEAEYQHFNFEEFIRKLSPNVGAFASYNINLEANVSADFASAVYRFGHSMLAETLDLKDANGNLTSLPLLTAFLNPSSYNNATAANLAQGTTQQVGNLIDEWVTDTLRNNLVGQRLDLATANIARGRDSGIASLNDVRQSLFQQTGLQDLTPYTSWSDLGANLIHGQATLKEFIMAYASDDILTRFYALIPGVAGVAKPLTNTLEAWQAFQLDPTKADTPGKVGTNGFYSGPGGTAPIAGAYTRALSTAADLAMADLTWMGVNGNQDFWNVDLWTGGLAENKALGSMLGSTMDAVFSIQMSKLQASDRFYYITRLGAAQNILASFDQMTLADLVMRNTGAKNLYSDVFSAPDAVLRIANYADALGNPLPGTTYASVTAMAAAGAKAGWVGLPGNWTFTGNPGNYNDARGVLNPNGAGNASELIIGTAFAERINGGGGNETVWGEGGNDTVQGGAGNDFLHGGDGNDQFNDLSGDDRIWGDAGDDIARAGAGLDVLIGDIGNDTLYGGVGADEVHGGDGNDILYGGDGVTIAGTLDATDVGDVFTGGLGDDTIFGGGGNDVIDSGEGNDVIYGGIDNNLLEGFDGTDQFIVDATQFGYQNAFSGGLGFDTVDYRASNGQAVVGGTLGINIDLGNVGAGIVIPLGRNVIDVFLSIEEVWGSRFADTIIVGTAIQVDALGHAILGPNGLPLPINASLHGWDGNDNLTGGQGNDTMDGGLGNDTMTGLGGDDLYLVDSALDLVVEAAGGGIDTVNAFIAYTLGAELEHLTLTGTALAGTGNALANRITGNASNNTLTGGDGNDTIDGSAGNDTMIGGLGDDTYVVDSALDVITEAPAGGIDSVSSSATYTLAAEVENLLLTGAGAINGTGNAAANLITGNAANNNLSGLGGNDTLDGGAGNDTVNGGLGNDRLLGGFGLDTFVFNTAPAIDNVDTVVDFATGDTLQLDRAIFTALSGGATLTAAEFLSGAGVVAATDGLQRILHDTTTGALRYDSDGNGAAAPVLFVNLNVGAPLTAAAISLAGGATPPPPPPPPPAPGVITGTVNADNLIGTAANDTINGLAGNDTIDGLAGNDTMNGGLGDDTFTVDSVFDVVVEALNEGTDTVISSVNHNLAANVENLTLTGTAQNGTGNALANVIIGNAAVNTLNGGAGNDTMTGGAGNDTYAVDSALDVVVEAAGGGIDTVNSGVDYTLGVELENLLLTGTSISGTGNAVNNRLTGNAANNALSGLAGNDTIDGGAGNDTLNGGDGNDQLTGGAGLDVFQFNAALGATNVDTVVDFAAGDTLQLDRAIFTALSAGTALTAAEFLSGAGVAAATDGLQRILHDTTTGALRYDSDGNGAAAPVLFANLNVGAPLSAAAISLAGGATPPPPPPPPPAPTAINGTVNADNLVGTAANDTINGLAGNDTINGLAGNDTMNGGAGDDTFTVDSALDVVVEALNEGTDTVNSAVNHTLAANVENLVLTGTALTGTGNALANAITGNASNNPLSGLAGNDTLNGGGGADILNGGTGVDALTGGLGADTFRFDANGPANSDLITDFNIAEGDRIALTAAVFTGIGAAGAGLTAAQFLAGPGVVSATDRLQRILFNTTTGALFWDVDGNRNNNAPIQFATLNPVAALTNTQFTLV